MAAPSSQWTRADLWLVDQLAAELSAPPYAGLPWPRAMAALDLRAWWTAHGDLPTPTLAARRWRWGDGESGRSRARRFLSEAESWAEPRLIADVRACLEARQRA